jgi:DNA-directed RNA polymerase specialized sigma24 family protein
MTDDFDFDAPGARPRFTPRTAALRRWQADWDRWAGGPEAAAGLARWAADPALAGHTASVAALLAACGRDPRVPAGVADARLAALVAHAGSGDRAAARVALERVMPALTARAGARAARTGQAFADVLAELATAGWVAVCTYPLARRPAKVAANLVRDTLARCYGYRPLLDRRTRCRARLPEAPAGLDGRPAGTPPAAGAELLDVLAEGLAGGVPADRLRVLAELGVLGLAQGEVAARAGISDRAVRMRRDAALRALRAAVLPPAAAAGHIDVDVTTDAAAGVAA